MTELIIIAVLIKLLSISLADPAKSAKKAAKSQMETLILAKPHV